MPDDSLSYSSSPSTTWEWKTIRIRKAPQAGRAARRRRSAFAALPPWNPRNRLSISVTYRGGPECWWEITARGVTIRRPGVTALHDVLREIEKFD